MSKLDKAKEVIKSHFGAADCGIFSSRNIVWDPMETVYEDDGLQIDICYRYSYFEVFGLSPSEFDSLVEYYDRLEGGAE